MFFSNSRSFSNSSSFAGSPTKLRTRRLERRCQERWGYPEETRLAGTNPVTHEKPSFVRKTATARSSPLARALSRHMERTLTANVRTARKLAGHCRGKLGPLPARAPSRAIRILFSPRRHLRISRRRVQFYAATELPRLERVAFCVLHIRALSIEASRWWPIKGRSCMEKDIYIYIYIYERALGRV